MEPQVPDIVRVIQLVVAPVFLLAAVGTLINAPIARRAAAVAAIALLNGCVVPTPGSVVSLDDLPKAELRKIDAIAVLDDDRLGKTDHDELGQVEAVSCKRSYGGPPATWGDAIRRVKYRAMQLGADAIARLDCGNPQKRLFTEFCFESIHCTATAVRTR